MFSKVVAFFAVIAVFSVHANNIPTTEIRKQEISYPLDPVIELVKQGLDYLNRIVDFVLQESEDALNKLLSKVDLLRIGALVIAEQQIERDSRMLQKLIDAIKNRNNNSNLNILNCLEHVEEEAGNVEKLAVNSSMLCIDASIEATGKNILMLLEDLKNVTVNFAQHEEELDKCKGKLLPFKCIKDVVKDLGDIALTIPKKIKDYADKATLNFATLIYEVFQCIRVGRKNMQEGDVQVFNDFAQCVHEKSDDCSNSVETS